MLCADVFPITPYGSPPSSISHANSQAANPKQLPPLSTTVNPIARLRLRPVAVEEPLESPTQSTIRQTPGVFSFRNHREHPLETGVFCQDVSIYRPASGQLELARLSVQANLPDSTLRPNDLAGSKRPSALTEMMWSRGDRSDISVTSAISARWMLPLGADSDQPVLTTNQVQQRKAPVLLGTRSR